MKKILYILIFVANTAIGQDIHFSQFNQAPLTINPGLTGSGEGTHRIGANYREQSTFFTNGYITTSVFYDGKYLKNRKRSKMTSYLGLGFLFLNDRAGDSQMGITQFGLSAAYFMELIENNLFSVGLQGSFGSRSIDFSNLKWDSQYVNNAYNKDMPPEIIMSKENYGFFDVATGISWKHQKDRYLKTVLGASLYHVNSIKLKSDIMPEILDRKFIIHGSLDYMLENTIITFIPSVLYERQGKLQEGLFGMLMKFQINEYKSSSKLLNNYLGFGLYNRFSDSFIISTVFSSKGTRIGLSYDINTSSLSFASHHKGAIEISLTYHIPYTRRGKYNTLL